MFTHGDISIRTVEDADLEAMRRLRNDPTTWTMLTDIALVDAQAQREWYQRVRLDRTRRYYVVCDARHDFVGIVRLDEIDPVNRSIRVGADIVPELRRQGYGSKVYELLKKYCFDFLNMHRIWLAVLDLNGGARRLYEKQGFHVEGRYRDAIFRDGAYRDYVIMSLLEQEYRATALGPTAAVQQSSRA